MDTDLRNRSWLELVELAAEGDTEAQYWVGYAYYLGEGVEDDDEEAVRWFRMAAEQDHTSAQYYLGHAYLNGLGVEEDHEEALKWFRKAAEQGNVHAQYSLGRMYIDVAHENVLAHMWFNLATSGGDQAAKKARDELTKRLTPEQIAEAQKLAREWLEEHE